MKQETVRQIKQLAASVYAMRGQQPGFVLLIGGAISNINGYAFLETLYRFILLVEFGANFSLEQIEQMTLEQQIATFDETWKKLPRTLQIRSVLDLQKELRATRAHEILAELMKNLYFPLTLTTTIDHLIEQSFYRSGLDPENALPYLHVLQMNASMDEQPALTPKEFRRIRQMYASELVLIKLFGDTESSISQEDIQHRLHSIRDVLEQEIFNGDLIVIGYTPLDDILMQYAPSAGGRIYFVGSEKPSSHSYFERQFWKRKPVYIEMDTKEFLSSFSEQLKMFDTLQGWSKKHYNEEDLKSFSEATQSANTPEEALIEVIKIDHRQKEERTGPKAPLLIPAQRAVFTILLEKDRKVSFSTYGGTIETTSQHSKEWDIDVDEWNDIIQEIGDNIATYYKLRDTSNRQRWRQRVKREGGKLYRSLMSVSPELDKAFFAVSKSEEHAENLNLIFDSPRNFLGMPYELLHDAEGPLVIRYNLVRRVSGVENKHNENLPTFVRALRPQKEPLKILLLSSADGNAGDKEVAMLTELIQQKAARYRIKVEPHPLLAAQATIEAVRDALTNGQYHIIHYAGHGHFDERNAENSGLVFREKEHKDGEPITMTTRELNGLLKTSPTRLFYLNTCVGARVTSEQALRSNDYLGIMDAIVQAGISYVLGFRWYITDTSAQRFAKTFYEELFASHFSPERAVLKTRKFVYETKGSVDEAWASSILVSQILRPV